MEPHWHTNSTTPYQREPGDLTLASRVLTSSSGNIQSYNPDAKEGIENQDPLQLSRGQESWPKQDIQYPIPDVKLGSNDAHGENLAHLQQRRHNYRDKFFKRRRVDPAKPYLQHPKYLQYRARQRCDTGPDGKPVWDDRIEDAFQNALVNIPPMGRRKKSQRGRPHGRNELISEWIFQETGEFRTRKQVSSHIQVLNTLLKDIPEWAALVTASDDRGGGGNEYYSDSIKDMVRNHSAMSSRHYYRASSRPMGGSYPMHTGSGYIDRHSCSRLSFKMWVSLPDDISQALHLYTRLQSNSSSSPMPLEDVKAWRNSFPSLRSIMDNWTLTDSCDIILLDASFQLMSDFPPKHSKLGISLELDFMHPSGHNKEVLSMLTQWHCVTHIYQHGRLIKETQDSFDGKELPPGKIRPFFESRWWASTFTNLTEKRKRAEDSENDGTVELANEASRNFFRGLTVMQEISAETKPKDVYGASRRRRMGILLWRFSQAPPEFVGTTTWQKLIPPAEMMDAKPESTMGDIGLPTLGMDSMMDGAQNADLFTHPQGFMPMQNQADYDMFDTNMDDLCQDGFMYGQDQMADFGSLQGEGASFAFEPSDSGLNGDLAMTYSLQPHEPQHAQELSSQQNTNLFEMPQPKRQDSEQRLEVQNVPQHNTYPPVPDKPGSQPLAKFDMNTHKVLQAQLGNEHYYPSQPTPTQPSHPAHPSPHTTQQPQAHHPTPTPSHHLDDHDETLRALLAASAMSDLGNATPAPPHTSVPTQTPSMTTRPPTLTYTRPTSSLPMTQPLYIPTSQPFSPSTSAGLSHPLSAPIARPPLQSHHSFTHITAMDAPHAHRRVPSKTGVGVGVSGPLSAGTNASSFAAALANLDAYSSQHDLHFGVGQPQPQQGHHHNGSGGNNGSGTHYDPTAGASGAGPGGPGGAHHSGVGTPVAAAAEEIGRPQSQPVLPVSVAAHAHHPLPLPLLQQHHHHQHQQQHHSQQPQQHGQHGQHHLHQHSQQQQHQHHRHHHHEGAGLGLYEPWEHLQHPGAGYAGAGAGQAEGLGGGYVDVKREDARGEGLAMR